MGTIAAAGDPPFLETVEELVAPGRAALLLVDTQNDFLASKGVVDRRGEQADGTRALVGRIKSVLGRAREVGAVVAYIRYTRTADNAYESPASVRWMALKRGYSKSSVSAVEGTWGWNVVDALAPRAGEIIVNKRRASGFYQTDLELLLRARGVETVIVVGASTHGCVEATARDAELRDFYVAVLADCVTAYDPALHEAALTVMRSRYEVIGSDELLRAWAAAGKQRETA